MRCYNMPRAAMGEGSGQGIRLCHVLELQCVSRKTHGEDGLIARLVGEPEKRELPACDRSGRWLGCGPRRDGERRSRREELGPCEPAGVREAYGNVSPAQLCDGIILWSVFDDMRRYTFQLATNTGIPAGSPPWPAFQPSCSSSCSVPDLLRHELSQHLVAEVSAYTL